MVFEKVKEVFVETVGCEESALKMETSMKEDLGMDSLEAMELAMALEEAFSITIEEDSLASFATVGDVVNYIESHVA